MKNLLAGVAFSALALLSTTAMAQYPGYNPGYATHPVIVQPQVSDNPCTPGTLRGTPLICVTNGTPFPIISMHAHSAGINGWFTGGAELLAQTGIIQPGRSALVHVNDGGNACMYNLYITTAARVQHIYYNMNICARSNLVLTGW